MSKKAYWPWPGWMDGMKEVKFGPEQLDFIRRLVVTWDIAETGAPGLADAQLDEIDDDNDEMKNLIEMFLNTAKIKNFSGTINNPYFSNQYDQGNMDVCLDPIPDQTIAKLFRSQAEIKFEASCHELALWKEANLRGTGIDPKRPFGTGHVSRDIRAIVDPDKEMSAKNFRDHSKTLQSRLLLLLQYFVQNAELPFSTYTLTDDWNWVSVDNLKKERGKWIGRCEWIDNVVRGYHYQTVDFGKTAKAIAHLLWEGHLEGDYSTLIQNLKIDNYYDVSDSNQSSVPTEEIVKLGLKEFPEHEFEDQDKTLTLMLVRIYASQSRFKEALKILKKSKVKCSNKEPADFSPITPQLLFYLESQLTEAGLDVIKQGLYMDHPDSDAKYPNLPYQWVNEIEYSHECPDKEDITHFWHAKSILAQFRHLRGPYRP